MSRFQQDAALLLDAIGGKDNINAITHCVTRLRFVLKDPKRADVSRIESVASVKGTFTQSGQFQVIIGNEVSEFYKTFTALAGIEGVSKDAVKAAASSQQNLLQRIMSALGEIFAPIIPALICGGLILGFRNLIGEIKMFDGQTLAQTSVFWRGCTSSSGSSAKPSSICCPSASSGRLPAKWAPPPSSASSSARRSSRRNC